MKRKCLLIALTIMTVVFLAACDQASSQGTISQEATSSMKDPGWFGSSVSPQPLSVANLEEAIRFINEEDYYKQVVLAKYPGETDADAVLRSEEKLAYEHMIETVKDYGYIPLVKCDCSQNTKITFFPMVRYEDFGIRTYCTCSGEKIEYYIYFPAEGFSKDLTLKEYWVQRFGEEYYPESSSVKITRNSEDVSAMYTGKTKKDSRHRIFFLLDGFQIKIVCGSDTPVKKLAEKFDYIKIPLTEGT